MNLDELPPEVQFAYLAATKTAIQFKKMGLDKKFFIGFCEEIWNSMEMTDLNTLSDAIQSKMKKDVDKHLKNYKG